MSNKHLLTIALVAGEASGDMLGAGLIRAIKDHVPNTRFVGVGGPLMQSEGCEVWYQMEELAVMGIVEILSRLCRLLYIRADLTRRFISLRPDVFIGIDAPDFNLFIEKRLKNHGIITIHYVGPSIWAWRKNRIFNISKSTHLVLLLFPFEKIFYEKFNVPYRFIGHTIADIVPLDPDKNAARSMLGIRQDVRCLAILPGSRVTEVETLSADFLKTAKILRQIYPDLEIIVPMVNANLRKQFECIKDNIAPDLQIRLINGKSLDAMIASDAALLASGTATLECMLAKCPMVIGYRMKKLTFWLAKNLVETNYISLPNLFAERELVKEFLQEECRPQALSKVLLSLLEDRKNVSEICKAFRELHQKIRCNANMQAAHAVLELVKVKSIYL